MKSYQLSMNTRTYFGNKCVEEAVKKEKNVIGSRTLLITTGSVLKDLGFVDELAAWLDAEGNGKS